jgi:excisionase family DNA binding protein
MSQNYQTQPETNKSNEALVLTAREASNLLRISKTTVYELIRQGVIPSVRFGKRVLVPRAALIRKIEETSRKSG